MRRGIKGEKSKGFSYSLSQKVLSLKFSGKKADRNLGGLYPLHPIAMYLRLLAILILLTSCIISRGVFHTVKEGETLWRICRTYGVDIQEVAEMNNIKNPSELRAGTRIFIPGVTRVRKVVPYKRTHQREEIKKVVVEKGRFSWPLRGKITSSYGMRGWTKHDGIDIQAPRGSPIRAAGDGEVVYSDSGIRGYGNVIIIKHRDDFYTVYAHNELNLVKKGDRVKRGDIIAKVGNTGNATGYHLHFEVRKGKKPRNPLFFLP